MINDESFEVSTPSDLEIRMTRMFDAPRALVYRAITSPEIIPQWLFGPEGWSMPVCRMDLRPGGAYRFEWKGQGGAFMACGGVFQEVDPPEGYSASEIWDEPWYPGKQAIVTYRLFDEGERTKLTLTLLYETKEARDAVLKTPMDKGVKLSYGRLEQLLGTKRSAA